MAKKIPLVRIGVQRNGVTVYPDLGIAFDFTKEEITDLSRLSDETKVDYFREPVNEDIVASAAPAAKKSAGDDAKL